MNLNKFGKRAYANALKRGKVSPTENLMLYDLHKETVKSISEEVDELNDASEAMDSEHIRDYSATAEELADIAIAAITEIHRRHLDVEKLLRDKMRFNENR